MTTLPETRRSIAFPLIVIGLGVVFLLDRTTHFSFNYLFSYFWPAIFCFVGLELLFSRSRNSVPLGIVFFALGVFIVARQLGYIPVAFGHLWPLLIIAFGVWMLLNPARYRFGRIDRDYVHSQVEGARKAVFGTYTGRYSGTTTDDDSPVIDGIAVMGGIKRRISSQQFRGGRILAFWGGFNLDLSHADIAGDAATLELRCLMGGGEIRVPESWEVVFVGQTILGGFSDDTHYRPPADGTPAKRLIIQGTFLFGGVNVKS